MSVGFKAEWCCAGFQGNYELAGERGVAVLTGKDQLGTYFLIQWRAVAKKDAPDLRLALANCSVPVSTISQVGLSYCPWCGVNLQQFYGDRVDALNRPDLLISSAGE
jgi:hypothetical protein